MTTCSETLTDTQKFVLASGEIMAKELGLKKLKHTTAKETQLSEGQTVLLLTPTSVTVGIIETEVREYNHPKPHRVFTDYLLNGEVILRKAKRLEGEEYVQHFEPRLYLPSNSTLYVS